MGQKRQQRRWKKNPGFSSPNQRLAWDVITRGTGARGRDKRDFFNQVSGIIVLSAAVAGAFFGYAALGGVGLILGPVISAVLTANFLTRGRYFR
jgi:hypothetical protein